MPETIRFNRQTGEHGYLSNFFEAEFILPDPIYGTTFWWSTTENYFQCAKQAKRMGRELEINLLRWDYEEALPAMVRCNMAKFIEHDDLRERLVATGDAVLIEHRPDPVWGDNMDGTGLNLLGHVLMLVRARLSQ